MNSRISLWSNEPKGGAFLAMPAVLTAIGISLLQGPILGAEATPPVAVAEGTSDAQKPAGARAAPVESKDAMLFHNGDVLYGGLDTIEPAAGVLWRHADAKELIEFVPDGISEIRFGYRPQPLANSTNVCQIALGNQDEIEGNLVAFDAERIVLDTWYAGRLEVPRKFIQSITPRPPERAPIFEGPTGLDGWTMGLVQAAVPAAGQWTYRNGAFYATQSASIARDLKLPDVASIQFDVDWKGMLYIAVALYTDYLQPINLQTKETGPNFGGFYSLQLNSYTVNLLPVTRTDALRYLGQTSVSAFNQKNKVRLEIRVSKPKRMVALMVDGALIKQWIDTEAFVGQGTGVRFVHQGQGSVKLSNLRVTEWDGQFEEKQAGTPETKNDLARLQNGDKVTGNLRQILDGKVTFALPEGRNLDFPFDRIKVLEMASDKIERSPDNSTVRATFRRGGSLSLRLDKWGQQEVVGTSPVLGKLVLNPAAFERVHFLPVARSKPTARVSRE